ncbi:MAG: UvrB/UvrC motif-containing protein [Planctomycetota bacterium]|nr:UvrB/UvrC motif-containing protein [Planctomycetota bacterium]
MICQNCLKNAATVHVTEIATPVVAPADATLDGAQAPGEAASQVSEQHLCEVCAQTLDLPHAPALQKAQLDIWKLLQITAKQTRRKGGPTCAGCGLQLEEFRRKGRLGCPQCYDAFAAHLGEVFERVHGARQHVGRLPGTDAAIPPAPPDALALEREQRLVDLRQKLEIAIREEAYENAARLRDELKQLEEPRKT